MTVDIVPLELTVGEQLGFVIEPFQNASVARFEFPVFRQSADSRDYGFLIFPTVRMVWLFGTFVVHHSDAAARDLHLIPYSPLTVIRGTYSCFQAFVLNCSKNRDRFQ